MVWVLKIPLCQVRDCSLGGMFAILLFAAKALKICVSIGKMSLPAATRAARTEALKAARAMMAAERDSSAKLFSALHLRYEYISQDLAFGFPDPITHHFFLPLFQIPSPRPHIY